MTRKPKTPAKTVEQKPVTRKVTQKKEKKLKQMDVLNDSIRRLVSSVEFLTSELMLWSDEQAKPQAKPKSDVMESYKVVGWEVICKEGAKISCGPEDLNTVVVANRDNVACAVPIVLHTETGTISTGGEYHPSVLPLAMQAKRLEQWKNEVESVVAGLEKRVTDIVNPRSAEALSWIAIAREQVLSELHLTDTAKPS